MEEEKKNDLQQEKKQKNDILVERNQTEEKTYFFNNHHTIQDLADILQLSSSYIIQKLIQFKIKSNINQFINADIVELLSDVLNIKMVFTSKEKNNLNKREGLFLDEYSSSSLENSKLVKRTPIVTVMGHVDHGKTTLLDAIRKTRVAEKEFGGITQHIGAYEIVLNNRKITFIDSPGHQAFFHMRSRGAQITDICLLIVAGDDGVKPQTIESVKHAQKAQVDIIVVINKIDKINNHKEAIMAELSHLGLKPEEWGGNTPYIEISALKKQGIEHLLEMILLISDIQNIKTDLGAAAKGVVLEASLDKNQGPTATLIPLQGVLEIGNNIVIGNIYGKIRSLKNDLKQSFKQAFPSQPVLVTGLDKVPQAGDLFMVVKNKKQAKEISEERNKALEKQKMIDATVQVNNQYNILEIDTNEDNKCLNVILKADTKGSVEALQDILKKIHINQEVTVNCIKADVGMITTSDIELAKTFDALILNFNTPVNSKLEKLSSHAKVEIKNYNILYKMIEDIEEKLKKLVKPVFEEKLIGKAEIRKIFHISSTGTIAGCYVIDGQILNNASAKVLRDQKVIYQGKIVSLKHLKDNISSAKQGHECGILLDNFNNFQVNDIIEVSKKEKAII